MKRKHFLTTFLSLTALGITALGENFYWQPEAPNYGKFTDLKNWRLEKEAPAKALPGASDTLADGQHLYLDLEGTTQQIGTLYYLAGWTRWTLAVKNGALEFIGRVAVHGGDFLIGDGGTLRFTKGSRFNPGVNDGKERLVRAAKGGRFEMLPGSELDIYKMYLITEEGGSATLACDSVQMPSGSQQSRFENSGSLSFPNGFSLTKGNKDNSVLFLQKAGSMNIAGKISSNGSGTKLLFELAGGQLAATDSATVEADEFRVTADAELFAAEGKTLTIANLANESNARLTKKGGGALDLGASLPNGLTIEEGALYLGSGMVKGLEKVHFARGTKIVFSGKRISFETAPQQEVGYAIDPEKLGNGDCVFVSSDAALRARIKTALEKNLKNGLIVEEKGDELHLASKYVLQGKETTGIRTSYAWKNPAAWRNNEIAPPGSHITIRGDNIIRIMEKNFPYNEVLLTDNVKVYFGESISLPKLKLKGRVTLGIGKLNSPIDVKLHKNTTFEEIDGKKPLLSIHESATVYVEPETSLDNVELAIKGKLLRKTNKQLKTWVDTMNRCFYIDATDIATNAVSYSFAYSPKSQKITKALPPLKTLKTPLLRSRLPRDYKPFDVCVTIKLPDGTSIYQETTVTPNPQRLAPPVQNHEILVGQCVYNGDARFRAEIITNELCNLLVQWVRGHELDPDKITPEQHAIAKKNNMYYMTIYGNDTPGTVEALKRKLSSKYLFNNIGEYAGYLYQGPNEAKACGVPQTLNLDEAKNDFVNRFIQNVVKSQHQKYDYILSTSGSPLANYELEGGIEYICNELYAVGSANLAYASSEARGAARRWGPEFWCSWLAEEWQTFPVPYSSSQKYDLLKAGLLQQYLMGTSIMVLESGAQTTQAHNHTAEANKICQMYDDYAPRHYRQTVKEFYDYVKENPRAKGSPQTHIGFILGNNDAFVGMSVPFFAVWGQHSQAETNQNWRYGPPENTWLAIQRTFFPVGPKALDPYPNYWLAGSPYGQCDVVCVDDLSMLADIARYKLLAFAGWNTMTPHARRILDDYVENGGMLVECVPHSSSRNDREHTNYRFEDIKGNLSSKNPEAAHFEPAPTTVSGTLSLAPNAEALLPGITERVKSLPAFQDLLLARLDAETARQWTTIASVQGVPLLVTQKCGKGRRFLLLARSYPGNSGPLSQLYLSTLTALADKVPATIKIAAHSGSEEDLNYISYAVYSGEAYFLNLDCTKPRTVDILFTSPTGAVKTLTRTLPPCTLLRLPAPKYRVTLDIGTDGKTISLPENESNK